jgi:23S rRNA pseudouridine2604 synthase
MATLKLKPKRPGTPAPQRASRPPIRGMGAGVSKRPTFAGKQSERTQSDERPTNSTERRPSRPGEWPDSRPQQRGDRRDGPAPRSQSERAQNRPYQGQDNRPQGRPDDRRNERQDPRFNDRPRDAQGERPFDRPPIIGTPRPGSATVNPLERQHFVPAQRQRQHEPEPHRPIAQRPAPSRGRHHDDDDDFNEPAPHAPLSVRLSKRMSELGMASRREADEWIEKGWVRVDDQIVKELGSRVQPDQRITIDARAKFAQAQKVTVIINKPIGYVSGQAEDGYEPAMVLVLPENQWREDHSGTRFLREHLRSLVPAGRLDIDSIGLLVLTQDGRIAKQLIGEDSAIEKEYLVRVAGPSGDGPAIRALSQEGLALLCHGLELDGEALKPAMVEWLNDDQLRFVLQEGKKRQIRRMCEAVGLKVLGLKRVRIGSVMLGDLPVGQWRYLRGDEGFAEPPPAS